MCNLTEGISLACDDQYAMGGVLSIYLGNKDEIASVVYETTVGPNEGGIKDIIMKETAPGSGVFYTFYKFEFVKDTGIANSEFQNSNGNRFFKQIVGFTIPSNSQAIANLFRKLQIADLVAIVENSKENTSGEKQHWVYGWKGALPLYAETSTANLGSAAGDAAGRVILLSTNSTYEPIELVTSATHPTISGFISELLDSTDN